jgi:hypothetical protein
MTHECYRYCHLVRLFVKLHYSRLGSLFHYTGLRALPATRRLLCLEPLTLAANVAARGTTLWQPDESVLV